jgi:hypothetical protein
MKKKPMTVEEFASKLADMLMAQANQDKISSDLAHDNANTDLANEYKTAYWIKRAIASQIRLAAIVE